MYESKLINDFERELFSTDYTDVDSVVQNMKTDSLIDFEFKCSFEEWFENLINEYCQECNIDKDILLKEISNCPDFVEDMKIEFEYLYEVCKEIDEEVAEYDD